MNSHEKSEDSPNCNLRPQAEVFKADSGGENIPPVISVIVPMYNEAGNINIFIDTLSPELAKIDLPYEIVIIDDGSVDETWSLIEAASVRDPHIKGISLSRNFGPQSAMFAGMYFATGEAIITMDGDLQHPPGKIHELLSAWKKGYKVVETIREDSEDFTFLKRLSSRAFNRLFSLLSGFPMRKGISDFRLLDRKVVESIKAMRDIDLYLRGLVFWVGYPKTTISYSAGNRYSGKSNWTWTRLVKYSIKSLLSFSVIPLRLGIWLGFFTSFLAFIEMVYIFIQYFQGKTIAGWASTLTVMSFMFGILFILVGILGVYIGNIFESVRNRPRFLINEMCGFFDADPSNIKLP